MRNYASMVRLLAARGHQVQLCFAKIDEIYPESAIDREIKDMPGVSYIDAPEGIWLWRKPAEFIRVLQTHLRFLDTQFADVHKLRARAAELLPRPVCWLVKVVIYPQAGANPIHGSSLNDFFDSMYHSAATVGINTCPMIESGILNKPVLTVLSPQFKNT